MVSWWPFGKADAGREEMGTADTSAGANESKCPVKYSRSAAQAGSDNKASACPVPVDQRTRDHPMILLDPRMDRSNNMLAGGESQHPGLGQRQPLPTQRAVSSIPRSAEHSPAHQEGVSTSNWVYPSPQMFYNAMQRKGWSPKEEDMASVVAIHNAVNERAWSEVMKWEHMHCDTCAAPKLVRFIGRPMDFSPQARINQLMGYKLPFDRHDWTVDRCGTKVRYVIDFYQGKAEDGKVVGYHLDVRPALDSWQAVLDRCKMAVGIASPVTAPARMPQTSKPDA